MEQSEIEVELADILVNVLGLERNAVTMDASFEGDLDVDSLDIIELLMALEDHFDINIPYDEDEKITTVGEAASLVNQRLNA